MERKLAAIFSTDVKGFSRLMGGDEVATSAVRREEGTIPPAPAWSFGPFRLDPTHGALWRGEVLLPLPPKPLAVLVYLVRHAGQVVSKTALLEAIWPDTIVVEGVLKTCLAQIRQVMGDRARASQYIATVHRRGYRFVAPVEDVQRSARLSQPLPPALPADFTPLHTLDRRPHNLPAPATSLIGRDSDVADVCRLLRRPDVRLVTLTGIVSAPGRICRRVYAGSSGSGVPSGGERLRRSPLVLDLPAVVSVHKRREPESPIE